MSEEIIIDGVDVAGCKYRVCHYVEDEDVEMNNCCCLTYTSCDYEKKNCYYKQLQRAKAENERLKEIIETQNPWNYCKNCNKDYKQALEEIKFAIQYPYKINESLSEYVLKKISEVLNEH